MLLLFTIIVLAVLSSIISIFIEEEFLKDRDKIRKWLRYSAYTIFLLSGIFAWYQTKNDLEEKEIENQDNLMKFTINVNKLDSILKKTDTINQKTEKNIHSLLTINSLIDSINDDISINLKRQENILINTNRNITLLNQLAVSFELVFSMTDTVISQYVDWILEFNKSSQLFQDNRQKWLDSYYTTIVNGKKNNVDTAGSFNWLLGKYNRICETEFSTSIKYAFERGIEQEIIYKNIEIKLPKNSIHLDKDFCDYFINNNTFYPCILHSFSAIQGFYLSFNGKNMTNADLTLFNPTSKSFEIYIDFISNKLRMYFNKIPLKRQIDTGKIISSIDINNSNILLTFINTSLVPIAISNVTIHFGNEYANNMTFNTDKFQKNVSQLFITFEKTN